MRDHGKYELIGRTRDDAAGEAFDKAARILGLGFPGGPEIQKASQNALGNIDMPRAWLPGSFDFSFSGLKTAFLNKAKSLNIYPPNPNKEVDAEQIREMAAGFQLSIADVITVKTIKAAKQHNVKGILLGGGVAANAMLRSVMTDRSEIPVIIPQPKLCTDNGAMIASCAFFKLTEEHENHWDLDIYPGLHLG
jgi:N6-L-threonylcarbamoyladenine synthase